MTETTTAWDRFWKYDRIASFGTGRGASNYGDAIVGGWLAFFASLPKGARILDLATGNGAIALIAVEARKDVKVTGADLADVKPAAFVSRNKRELAKVRFLAGTPAEELPFADASFDAVVSQYGVEYSQLERSLPEAVRVLAPGGRLRFAVHAAEGSVAAVSRPAIGDADFLLDELDLPGRASACFAAILDVERGRATGPFAQAAAQAKYAAFRDGLKAVAERTASAADVAMLTAVHASLTDLFQERQAQDEAALQARIEDLRTEIADHRERQRALIAAALSAEQMTALADRLAELGLTDITRGEQRAGGDLLGYVIEALRP